MEKNTPRVASQKILIVDDEPAFQKMMESQLQRKNFEVIACLKSEEAMHAIEINLPQLVLMDIMMPNIDGITLIHQIRQINLKSYLPIIVVTARNEAKDLVEALEAGADDYISKPFEFTELYARIMNMLRLKSLQESILNKTNQLNEANLQINRLNHVLTETNKELKKKVYDLHNIFEISFKVMGHTEEDKLINTALLNALGIFTAKSVMLLQVDPDDHDTFVIKQSRGFLSNKTSDFSIHRDDRLVRYLEFIKKPFQIKDVIYEFENMMPVLQELEIKAMAPLFQEEEIIGILCLGPGVSNEEYPPDVLEMLGIMTNMLSVALHNSQNFEQIKALSYTDEMTGLHNYRFFSMRLREEIARAKRNELSLSLLIMDVDYFKNYNDALGHPAGDEVLRQLSTLLRASVRDNDIVARYGGEEFAVILPATDLAGAVKLAERIRAKVEKHRFTSEEIQPAGTLTISIGIAVFPDNATNMEDTIVAADRALYFAKASGRNRVVDFNHINITKNNSNPAAE
jgi:two-component system cell cycle response regulator